MAGTIEAGGIVFPTAPTQTTGDSSKRVATTAFVRGSLDTKANIDSPELNGVPMAPTTDVNDRSTRIATTAFVNNLVDIVVPPPTRPQMTIESSILSTSTQSTARIFGSISPIGRPLTYEIEWVTAARVTFNKLTGIIENELLTIVAPSVSVSTPTSFRVFATDGQRRSLPLDMTVTVVPLAPGVPAGGGYYFGQIQVGNTIYALIVAPKAQGEVAGLQWKTSATATAGTDSPNDGWTNTFYMNNGLHPLGQWARSLNIAGYADWYVPSYCELEILYRYLKPTTETNYVGTNSFGGDNGFNRWSLPWGAAYGLTYPVQVTSGITDVSRFYRGGVDSLADSLNYGYYSSTQLSAASAMAQGFAYNGSPAGLQSSYSLPKNVANFSTRAIRRIPIGSIAATKPPETQTISCPPGFLGTQSQARLCTWSSSAGSWLCDAWTTTSSNCSPVSVLYAGPALRLTGYNRYPGPPNPDVPYGGMGNPADDPPRPWAVAYYEAALNVNGFPATLHGEYWMYTSIANPDRGSDTSAIGYRHEIRGLDAAFNGRPATLVFGLKPGGNGQTATVVGGTAKFPFYYNDDDNIKRNESETMAVQVG